MLKHADRKNLYYCMLDEYLFSLLDMENEPEFNNLTKEERYKAGAYIGYYYGLMYEKCIGTPCDIKVLDMPCTIRKTLSHSSRRIITST